MRRDEAVAVREDPRGRRYGMAQRILALGHGLVCHALFAVAITAMIGSLGTGLTWGLGRLDGIPALLANALLVAQFPLVHSWLLGDQGRAALARLVPLGVGRDLSTTTFASLASLQLLATFVLWSPSGIVWWRAEGVALAASLLAYGGSWLLLLAAMVDAGLDLQSGFRGWGAVVRSRAPAWRPFPTHGLYRYTRQPVYVAFFLTLWTGPVWTPDRLVLALAWSAYCVVGPRLKEGRILRFDGERYREYQARVPYWLPRLRPRS